MKTTRRTAVILAIWTLLVTGYAWGYFARSSTYDFNPRLGPTLPAGILIVSRQPATTTTTLPLQRVYRDEWEKWLFTPGGAIESIFTGRKVDVTYGKVFFGC